MVFRVVTLGAVVRKQKFSGSNTFQRKWLYLVTGKLLNMHNLTHNIGKVDYFYFFRNFFSVVKFRICLKLSSMQACRYVVPINLLTWAILRIRPCVADSFAFHRRTLLL